MGGGGRELSIIDEPIVSMVFDNSKFQGNIANTQKSLETLDSTVSEFGESGKNAFLDLENGLSRSDLIFAGFYERIGGYLADLTLKAAQFAKSMSFDQVAAGFQKYTSETKSAQAIVANTGATIEETYGAIDRIAKYTDETSYDFSNLTDTMTQFAMSGTALEDAEVAVKGIGNWAALSGAGVSEANIAMNALTKSIGSGAMQLMEWRTITKSAKMGTASFVEEVVKTARETSEAFRAYEAKNGEVNFQNFTEAMFGNNKLLTSDILLQVLRKYGDETGQLGQDAKAAASEAKTFAEALGAVKDAVSGGWAKNFRYLFGNYEEARKFWTFVQDCMLSIFTVGQDFTNEVLKQWHVSEVGGWADAFDALKYAWEGLLNLAEPFKEAFDDIFHPDIGDSVFALTQLTTKFKTLTQNFEKLTGSYKNFDLIPKIKEQLHDPSLNSKKIDKGGIMMQFEEGPTSEDIDTIEKSQKLFWDLRAAAKGIFSAVQIAKEAVIAFFKGIKESFGGVAQVGRSLISFAGSVGYFVNNIRFAIQETNFFGRIASALAKIVNSVLRPVFEAISKILGKFGNRLEIMADDEVGAINFFEKIASAVEKFANFITNKGITPAIDGLRKAFGWLGEKLAPLKGYFENTKEAVANFLGGFSKKETGKISTFALVLEGIGKALSKIWEIVKKLVGKIAGGIKNALGGLTGENLVDTGIIALVVAGITKLVGALKNLKSEGGGILKNIKEAMKSLKGLAGSLKDTMDAFKMSIKIKDLQTIATALLELAVAMLLIASIDSEKLGSSFVVLSVLLGELMGVLKMFDSVSGEGSIFSNDGSKRIKAIGTAMIELSAAVLILALAMKAVASIDADKMFSSFIVVELLVASLAVVAKVLSSDGTNRIMKGGLALVELAIAVRILASSVKALGELSWEELAKGLLGVVVILGSLVGFALLIKDANLGEAGLSILLLSVGMLILTKSVATLGAMDLKTLITGLLAMVAALAGIGLALKLFPTSGMIAAGAGLILVAAGLKIVVKVLKQLAGMSVKALAKSIVAMAAALAVLGLALNVMNGTLGGSAAMLIASVALIALGAALKIISEIPIEQLAIAIGAIAVSLLALAVLGPLLTAAAVPLLLVGAAMLSLGVGIATLVGGLAVLVTLGTAAITMFEAFALAVIGLIPKILVAIAKGFIDTLSTIAEAAPQIFEALGTILTGILQLLIEVAPQIVDLVVTILVNIIEGLTEVIPALINLVTETLIAVIEAITKLIPSIVDLAITIVKEFLRGIVEMVPIIIKAGIDMICEFIKGIAEGAVQIVNAAIDAVIIFCNGIAEAIRTKGDKLDEAVNNLISAITERIAKKWEALKEKGREIFQKIVDGIKDAIAKVGNFFVELWEKIKGWVSGAWETLKGVGKNIIDGIWGGISSAWEWVKEKVSGLFSGLIGGVKKLFGIASPSKVMAEIGEYLDLGLAKGLKDNADVAEDAADYAGRSALDAMTNSLKSIGSIELDGITDPVIRPVLDLSEIQNGEDSIQDLFSGEYAVGLAGSVGRIGVGINGETYGNSTENNTINMTINGAAGQDVETLAEIITRKINQSLRSTERVWA